MVKIKVIRYLIKAYSLKMMHKQIVDLDNRLYILR